MIVATIHTFKSNALAKKYAGDVQGKGRTLLTLTYTGAGITIRSRHANAVAAQEYARRESLFASPTPAASADVPPASACGAALVAAGHGDRLSRDAAGHHAPTFVRNPTDRLDTSLPADRCSPVMEGRGDAK